jgi:hypothetical protein
MRSSPRGGRVDSGEPLDGCCRQWARQQHAGLEQFTERRDVMLIAAFAGTSGILAAAPVIPSMVVSM